MKKQILLEFWLHRACVRLIQTPFECFGLEKPSAEALRGRDLLLACSLPDTLQHLGSEKHKSICCDQP